MNDYYCVLPFYSVEASFSDTDSSREKLLKEIQRQEALKQINGRDYIPEALNLL